MKDIDLGKEYVIPSPGYRNVSGRSSPEQPGEQDGLKCWQEQRKQVECQSALEAAARAEGLPLDASMNSHLGMLGDGHHKGKYRFGYNLLKPIRTTSKHPHAIDNAGLLSYTTFSWLTPLAHLAFKKGELLTDDVWPLSTHETSDVTCRRLERLWQQELQECGPEEASLGRVVWVFCRTRLIISIVCLMVTQLAGFCGPNFQDGCILRSESDKLGQNSTTR
ncbi:ATP-binding cassette sub-family C member 5-like isoform X2 [Sphaerodactylus townsendi]|uniref:ATP-binding cassette sub-family C member 5-like isoform X2 n=1 Tax=Sphaerodactylus townsendi TaxID=933632 RepID=UPI0020261D94|nr:ATP-binding cassette sub-family C member 5-like isoform X2 [Sphaerodactylus townsendi]XP_048362755.1 ATP-binding cassette sub-family C member 5-like isoform X2 [Sphaerodactylus townsendi]